MVDTNYLDARARGFDREAWRALRDEMMAREYTSMRGVHRCASRVGVCWCPSHVCMQGCEGDAVQGRGRHLHQVFAPH